MRLEDTDKKDESTQEEVVILTVKQYKDILRRLKELEIYYKD